MRLGKLGNSIKVAISTYLSGDSANGKIGLGQLIKDSAHLTLTDILSGRTYIIGEGIVDFQLPTEDYEAIISLTAEIMGGYSKTKERVKNSLRNPINVDNLAFKRFIIDIYNGELRVSYYAVECFNSELQTLKEYLTK